MIEMKNIKSLFWHPWWRELKKHLEKEKEEVKNNILEGENSPTEIEIAKVMWEISAYNYMLQIENEFTESITETNYSETL